MMTTKRYEFALLIEGDSVMSRELEGPHYADTWNEVIAQAAQANAFYRRFDRRVTRIDYKDGDGSVESVNFS